LEFPGRIPLNIYYIHEKLAKPNVTLSLLHFGYKSDLFENKMRKIENRLLPSSIMTEEQELVPDELVH